MGYLVKVWQAKSNAASAGHGRRRGRCRGGGWGWGPSGRSGLVVAVGVKGPNLGSLACYYKLARYFVVEDRNLRFRIGSFRCTGVGFLASVAVDTRTEMPGVSRPIGVNGWEK